MERREFIKKTGLGLAAAASVVTAPAIAETSELPTLKWRLASSFPKSLDTLFGASELLTQRVAEITGGKFEIRAFAGGEIVP